MITTLLVELVNHLGRCALNDVTVGTDTSDLSMLFGQPSQSRCLVLFLFQIQQIYQ